MEDFQCFSDEQLQQMSVSGSVGAEDALAARYNQLVRICARPYFLAGGDSEDLTQEGMLGLLSAIREYRPAQVVHPAADLQCDQIGVLFEAYPSQQRRIAGGCVRQRRHPSRYVCGP